MKAKKKLVEISFWLGVKSDQITTEFITLRFNEFTATKKDNTTIFEKPFKNDFKMARSYFK